MGPKDAYVLIHRTGKYSGLDSKGDGIRAADGIKVANHLILK